AFRFRKCGGIKHDAVVLLSLVRAVTQIIESIGFDPFDLVSVQSGILLSGFKSGAGAVDTRNFFASAGQMQRKSSLITENIERFPASVFGRGGIVFPLIEKTSGLLATQSLVQEPHPIHLKFSLYR